MRSRSRSGSWRLPPGLLVGLAGAIFVALFAVALWRSNALFYAAGGLAAVAILYPFWRSRPRMLLVALMFYLPLEDILVGLFTHYQTVARVLPDALLLGAFVLLLIQARRRHTRVLGTAVDLPLAVLLAVAIISMLLNHIPLTQALQGPYTMFRYALLFYLTAASHFEDREIRVLVRGLVWLSILESGMAILQFLKAGPVDLLPSGTMAGANTMGVYLALVCTIALAFYGDSRIGLPRRELWLLLGFAFAATLVALSRQSTVALVLGLAIICWFLARRGAPATQSGKPARNPLRWNWRQVAGLWPGAASSLVGGVVGYLAVKLNGAGRLYPVWVATTRWLAARFAPNLRVAGGNLLGGGDLGGSYSLQVIYKTTQSGTSQLFSTNFYYNPRLYTIVNAVPAILRKSPLFGLGPGTYGAQATFHDRAFYAGLNVGLLLRDPSSTFVTDVEWVTVVGQLGILGVAGILWLLFAIGQTGMRIWKGSQQPMAQALGSLCVALVPIFLLVGWLGPNFELRPISSLLWFIPGLALCLWRREAAESSPALATLADAHRAALVLPNAAPAASE